ncbi:hypothetical protein Xen7305DRAFT_00048630 [Xenococcus sp. PCC 7305]|uniref:hypothetical protein n=1 Tax=Xenococcus sp. PCC 7305 TaxID=102125 RepID=UPI0002ABA901|nr:hypothetical protein [Xenococcus sp. PCC 7305]ELS05123.1 hypothetical protein Xen7305DRAFT_00048630 [Xenococcus sp. PCC 7305]
MPRKCKACTSKLRNEIDLKIMEGASFTYLAKWCCDRGLQITDTALRKHANNHIEGYDPKVFSEVKKAPKVDSIANQLPDPTIVDFQAYLKKIDLDIKEAIKDEKCEKQIQSLRLSVAENYFRLSAILNQKLIDYSEGKTKFPMEQIKGLRLLFDIYTKATGLDLNVDHNKAFEIIRRYYGIATVFRESEDVLFVQEEKSDEIILINTKEKTVTIEEK